MSPLALHTKEVNQCYWAAGIYAVINHLPDRLIKCIRFLKKHGLTGNLFCLHMLKHDGSFVKQMILHIHIS